ncbi:cupin domain-containing protein [Rhodopseudomonas sp. HC1]|uniref:cupin domain-containing protein n=1 Tax=Rhodopseudomonas infernalis TaxID=2897386 RepID=UPI001EE89633|nr:cupin domain-containing protein [Rhodopseudomonas infernalis]MCG6204280.1 cupin domain-containing protein [Rhodopseudomonas infernalis]
MDARDFEMQLKADGFDEIEYQKLDPRPGKGRHRHHFEIRGLVLSGVFVVRQAGEPVVYRSGQVFAVADGELHDEWIEAEGAHVLVGRKFAKPESMRTQEQVPTQQ